MVWLASFSIVLYCSWNSGAGGSSLHYCTAQWPRPT